MLGGAFTYVRFPNFMMNKFSTDSDTRIFFCKNAALNEPANAGD